MPHVHDGRRLQRRELWQHEGTPWSPPGCGVIAEFTERRRHIRKLARLVRGDEDQVDARLTCDTFNHLHDLLHRRVARRQGRAVLRQQRGRRPKRDPSWVALLLDHLAVVQVVATAQMKRDEPRVVADRRSENLPRGEVVLAVHVDEVSRLPPVRLAVEGGDVAPRALPRQHLLFDVGPANRRGVGGGGHRKRLVQRRRVVHLPHEAVIRIADRGRITWLRHAGREQAATAATPRVAELYRVHPSGAPRRLPLAEARQPVVAHLQHRAVAVLLAAALVACSIAQRHALLVAVEAEPPVVLGVEQVVEPRHGAPLVRVDVRPVRLHLARRRVPAAREGRRLSGRSRRGGVFRGQLLWRHDGAWHHRCVDRTLRIS
mmetsp:Transcript_49723/g.153666  ORF Transcript_49723/g.153666 Transcript_49723/m.153666 type:complete len:374 (-) Transcript_49723:255-1376(-)